MIVNENIKNSKPEILAPAGSIKALYAAFYAGADAVYVGAPKFSARAFAENPEMEELQNALDYAHMFGKKIYLALNTLVKNEEIEEAVNMIAPLYQHGLDGVIVQDIGILSVLGKCYPKLELHGSTQLAVMSVYGARKLKELGITRIVPARELSINEIRELKNDGIKNGYEIECFIHGAMCYSYSGNCLFSSIAGGRSGNRGRCAGPCRKKYDVVIDGKQYGNGDIYPLSMRDMCVVQSIRELVDIGVDSFKIEGRMKAPEYAAGTSAIYKKVVEDCINNKCSDKKLSSYESELRKLYMRSEVSSGYLHQHNGKNMITLDSPSYTSTLDETKKVISDKYLDKLLYKKIDVSLFVTCNENMTITASCGDYYACVAGDVCEPASKRATDDESLRKQLCKTGGTFFEINSLEIINDNKSFVPVSKINELRREVLEELKKQMLDKYLWDDYKTYKKDKDSGISSDVIENKVYISVSDMQQFKAVMHYGFYNALMLDLKVCELLKEDDYKSLSDEEVYISLPYIIRQKNASDIKKAFEHIKDTFSQYDIKLAGCVVHGYDGLGLISLSFEDIDIIISGSVYAFNDESVRYINAHSSGYTASYELSGGELKKLEAANRRIMPVYGYIPLMYASNCLLKTISNCNINKNDIVFIKDEGNRLFPVKTVHDFCYNVIYNCFPLDLSSKYKELGVFNSAMKIDFTIEGYDETRRVMDYYEKLVLQGINNDRLFDNNAFTTGHYKRGVE